MTRTVGTDTQLYVIRGGGYIHICNMRKRIHTDSRHRYTQLPWGVSICGTPHIRTNILSYEEEDTCHECHMRRRIHIYDQHIYVHVHIQTNIHIHIHSTKIHVQTNIHIHICSQHSTQTFTYKQTFTCTWGVDIQRQTIVGPTPVSYASMFQYPEYGQ